MIGRTFRTKYDICLHYQKPYLIRLQTPHLDTLYKSLTFAIIDLNQQGYPLLLTGISTFILGKKTSANLKATRGNIGYSSFNDLSFTASLMIKKPAIRFVLACVFLDALGIGLIVPVLPRLIGTLAETRDLQTGWYGLIMVSYGLMQFFFAPLLGAISDRIGRRPVLLTGIFGLSLMMLVPAFSQSLAIILGSRIVGGMMSSNIVVAQAYIADVTPETQRINSFGKIGAIFGIAFVLGPAIGGILGHNDPTIPFLVASCICALNFLYGLFIPPESLVHHDQTPLTIRRLNPLSAIASLGKIDGLRPYLLIITLFTLAQSLMQCTWALYTEYRYTWTPLGIGLSIFALGLSISLTQGVLLPKLSNRFNAKQLILIGLWVGLISLTAIGLAPVGWLTLPFICSCAIMGLVAPAIQGLISRRSTASHQGINMGAVSSLNSFMSAISPLIGTPLLIVTSANTTNFLLAGTPYLVAASLLIIALLATTFIPNEDYPHP